MSNSRNRKQKKLQSVILVLAAVLVVLTGVAFFVTREPEPSISTNPSTEVTSQPTTAPTEASTVPTAEPTQPPTTAPTEPAVVLSATATISATGDMLMHMPVVNRFYADGSYNFDGIFTYLREYTVLADYAVGNLETTLCGLDNGYNYSGYPAFNCPDAIIDGMKNAGFDLILTANNHSYDTNIVGMRRTLDIIADRKLTALGTGKEAGFPKFTVQNINGISVGMACYTYNIGTKDDGAIYLNNSAVPLSVEASSMINSFDYSRLDAFYSEMEQNLAQMKAQGAEATVIFIHWGAEYQLTHNDTQKAIAQKLCDLGVDVIIGGHPHVVQPVELLTSTTNADHKTVCIYSLGNAVSNQRQGYLSSISTAHTEDGMLFSVTFAKYSDGTVILQNAELLPTWVRSNYTIIPLDSNSEAWQSKYGASDSEFAKMQASLDRTNAIVGEGMTQVRAYLSDHTAQIEALLKVQK